MAQKSNSHDQQKKTRQNGLPVSIHPDDAKDKVFTAIMKALLKMGNKPSSPKELANIIVKHKYATLGGATPFATVSSRISQHFKRAAEHNPPRAPLLAKHVDQNHSRKINYSLATEDNPTSATNSTMPAENAALDSTDLDNHHAAANTTMVSTTKDSMRTNSKIRRNPINTTSKSSSEEEDSDEEEEEDDSEIHFHPSKRYKTEQTNAPISPSIHPAQSEPQPSTIEGVESVKNKEEEDGEESEGELSDYHEEMLKGDEDLDSLSARRLSRRQSKQKATIMQTNTTKITDTTSINKPTTTTHSNTTIPIATTSTTPTISVTTTSHPTATSPAPTTSNTTTATPATTTTKAPPTLPVNTGARKPSFSFSSGFPGDQELWTPFSFEHDFDNVFLQDGSSSHHIPFNIATPESVSVSELDDYFTSTPSSTVNNSTSTSSITARSQRKSFSSAMLGPNDKSLLQKVLLASAARGVADKIEEEDEQTEKEPVIKEEKKPKEQDIKSFSSSSLLDVDNSEDFVKFEDDEKKEPPVTKKPVPDILPASAAATPPPTTTTPVAQQQQQQQQQAATILSAAEILKSMNIQNLNLSALHQMTSSINSLQQLSPTFDLAKTMAAYMQSLAKSANANASSSSNSPHAMDLKSILTRFPALEAFIKKDPVVSATPPTPPAPVSPNIDFIPNLVSATEPIVHTLAPSTPPMYITLIDHIAVCIVVLSKTDHTPEYRIMRRVDTGFINGTVLLTAGGIETESERSMILSFEMERVRMPKKKSELFGTWIPLRRAQELAVTCSIQHKLGHFLEDSIESYFPNPLPIQVNTRKPHRDSRLTALALAALRSDGSKSNGFIVSPISRQSSSSGSMGAAQLQELLLTHPHKALKSNGLNKPPPLLGRYDQEEEEKEEKPSTAAKSNTSSVSGKDESDVDIVNSSDSSVNAASSNEDDEEDEEEESENDEMEDILKRNKQTLHVHPHDLLKKRRRSQEEVEAPEESKATKIPRKKGSASGGKWTSASGKSTATVSTNAKKPSTIIIKKNSASAGGGKKNAVKKDTEEIKNVVVEHRPVVEPKVENTKATEEEDDEEEGMDDEDEDIDIGGSDFDDDLR